MPYASQQDLINAFGEVELIQLTDLTGAGVINADEIARVQLVGDGEIDGYLASAVDLPLANVPPIINLYACDIYRYRLNKGVAPDLVVANYRAAISYLTKVASGTISLGPDAVSGQTPKIDLVQTIGSARTFDDCSLRDYTTDRFARDR